MCNGFGSNPSKREHESPPEPQLSPADLFPRVYTELLSLARRRMADERAGHTLSPTALVHEVYLRLGDRGRWSEPAQFFFAAAEAMRRILIDHARRRAVQKRGGGRGRVPLHSLLDLADPDAEMKLEQILSLDEAISRLEKVSERVAAVVRLRFYAGLSIEETARTLGLTSRTVNREWTYARAWLARELDGGASS